jgi:hypothetical protein
LAAPQESTDVSSLTAKASCNDGGVSAADAYELILGMQGFNEVTVAVPAVSSSGVPIVLDGSSACVGVPSSTSLSGADGNQSFDVCGPIGSTLTTQQVINGALALYEKCGFRQTEGNVPQSRVAGSVEILPGVTVEM